MRGEADYELRLSAGAAQSAECTRAHAGMPAGSLVPDGRPGRPWRCTWMKLVPCSDEKISARRWSVPSRCCPHRCYLSVSHMDDGAELSSVRVREFLLHFPRAGRSNACLLYRLAGLSIQAYLQNLESASFSRTTCDVQSWATLRRHCKAVRPTAGLRSVFVAARGEGLRVEPAGAGVPVTFGPWPTRLRDRSGGAFA